MPTPISRLMTELRTSNPTAPRLTWYGPDGERVELSGRVLDNWVAKTANFLVDELDVGPGSTVRLNLPAHWRSLSWALAAGLVGATILPGPASDGAEHADVEATDNPSASAGGDAAAGSAAGETVAVALGALQMKWPGELPAGTLDYAAEVRAHGDVFLAFDEPKDSDTAIVGNSRRYSFADLAQGFAVPADDGARLLVRAADGLERAIAGALGAWLADGSVVLVHPEVQVTEHLLATEKVTGQLG